MGGGPIFWHSVQETWELDGLSPNVFDGKFRPWWDSQSPNLLIRIGKLCIKQNVLHEEDSRTFETRKVDLLKGKI